MAIMCSIIICGCIVKVCLCMHEHCVCLYQLARAIRVHISDYTCTYIRVCGSHMYT